jgi:hypothetical protein
MRLYESIIGSLWQLLENYEKPIISLRTAQVLFIPCKKDIAYLSTYWKCESKINSRRGDYLFNDWKIASR